ncbi:MAG: ATP-dependent DNA helicase RecG [Bacteroidales bacterium]|nr:ATP-dependent DNA helicase RecG [Bacteroidales bacterium]
MHGQEIDIQYLAGVGPKRAQLLRSELGVERTSDLLRYYPFRYVDRSSITPIASIVPDVAYVQFRGRVMRRQLWSADKGEVMQKDGQAIKYNVVKRMTVLVADGSGEMELVFFKGIKWSYEKLRPGEDFLFFGKPQVFNGKLNMVHPEMDPLGTNNFEGLGSLTGIYSSTEKLKNAGVTDKVMRKIMLAALNEALPSVEETLPEYVLREKGLCNLRFALYNIHFPKDAASLEKARYRLKFEELFLLQLSLLKAKYIRSRADNGILMPKVGKAFNQCYENIPFELTGAQKRVIKEIREDMRSGKQMNRLLQGDVGSGKTMVAVLSALIAAGNGYQSCIMAPTEVLAQQHYRNIQKYLAPTGLKAALLTGTSKTAERREIHAGLEDGSITLIVGTHALLEDNVLFKNLGLAIIDEQHRFGVDQRSKLWSKTSDGRPPHVLVMTATPIPRTLAMTFYGDLDTSVIDEMPPGRKPVVTKSAGESKRYAMYNFIREQIALGRQAFIVYPLIFESEKMDYKNLELGYEEVVKMFPFPPYKTAIIHGKQTPEEKNFNMTAFVEGRANILVATSVIEVGVDVPNASVMVIESSERFGLSQLHQLRGRVGRGSEKSYCILMTGNKLSKEGRHRIELMCSTENGFVLAEEDLKMRGPGDMEGTQQSGLPIELSIASLAKDGQILSDARRYASVILDKDPGLDAPENQVLKNELGKAKYQKKDYSKIS